MQLDPTIQALFAQSPQLADFKLWAMSPAEARQAFRGLCDMGNPKDTPIGKTEDIEIAGPAGPLAARVYTPVASGGESLPAIVFYHGGGFVVGDLDGYDSLARTLANESGCRLIAVHYRLAPEHRFPAAVEDAYAALKWVEDHAADLGVDPNRIAVAGDSAGGALAALATLTAKEKGKPKPAFQALIYPVTSGRLDTKSALAYAHGYFLDMPTLEWCHKNYIPPDVDLADPRLAPLASDLSGLPPAYVVTAGCDPLHDDGQDYADKLKAAGVQTTHVDYPTMIHGFFNMQSFLPLSREAIAATGNAVKEALQAA